MSRQCQCVASQVPQAHALHQHDNMIAGMVPAVPAMADDVRPRPRPATTSTPRRCPVMRTMRTSRMRLIVRLIRIMTRPAMVCFGLVPECFRFRFAYLGQLDSRLDRIKWQFVATGRRSDPTASQPATLTTRCLNIGLRPMWMIMRRKSSLDRATCKKPGDLLLNLG